MAGPDWDARYRAQHSPFGDAPSAWIAGTVAGLDLPPRTALALADGDGRHGTWLAGRGIDVVAVDLSAEATEQALARDRAAGVRVARHVADLMDWQPEQAFDLVVLAFLQGPPDLRRRGIALARAALASGGAALVEGFAAPAGAEAPLGPREDRLRWRPAEIVEWVGESAAVTVALADLADGPRHTGRARLLRARF